MLALMGVGRPRPVWQDGAMARKRLRMVAATTEGYLKVGAAKLRAQLVDVRRGAGTLVKRAKEWRRRRRHPAVVAAPTTPPAARTTPPAAPVAPAASGTATGPTA